MALGGPHRHCITSSVQSHLCFCAAEIRRSALPHKVYYTTTLASADAVVKALESEGLKTARRLQELHTTIKYV